MARPARTGGFRPLAPTTSLNQVHLPTRQQHPHQIGQVFRWVETDCGVIRRHVPAENSSLILALASGLPRLRLRAWILFSVVPVPHDTRKRGDNKGRIGTSLLSGCLFVKLFIAVNRALAGRRYVLYAYIFSADNRSIERVFSLSSQAYA